MYNHHKEEYFSTLKVQQAPWSTGYSNEGVRANQGGSAAWCCIVHCQYYRVVFLCKLAFFTEWQERHWDAQLHCYQRLFQPNLNKRGNIKWHWQQWRNNCCLGKEISITYSVCVFVALVIQHAKRMRRIIIYPCPALQYVSTLSHKMQDFREEKVIEHKVCFDFLYNFYLKHFSFYE